MFARFFTVAFLAALAVATPLTLRDGQCNTGDIQCCQSSSTTSNYNKFAKSLGLAEVGAEVVGTLGLSCSPISVIGTGSGATCNQQPMCCSNNKMNGLVNIGCTPINLKL
ncbi:hydrophobin-3 precursor [Suillus clintonianus]|uniref:hydrophobin-3 precursor n=1 Tax=Suillus clintonianus TaxID=1904413 RepID=UPI001B866C2A|nr:hydrophobin-3 precursor [Suillus clintonianus]XP_041204101.1 hydrophobin-3 precursor [Suillus clintonianus]XP_041214004.1 hydrophobin-3 precursor [Suillus clintonianus]KAG2112416.1 hydrophobin-3 precursor [Suillus clintonianus]KAG2124604.1 hydrophobin-3 precursor [Suillus clintonianus]KAG2153908.1 hydrophobin-3 precursor [Suillus clintonianus]